MLHASNKHSCGEQEAGYAQTRADPPRMSLFLPLSRNHTLKREWYEREFVFNL